jgi:threonine dehydrogenase-like Zn-dependent dehydrogenase
VRAIGATYVSTQALTFADLAEQMGNIDLVYEAVGHSHFALEALGVLGTNGIFVLTGVPGRQAFVETDPARLMRDIVLKNQVLLGTVNAGPGLRIIVAEAGAVPPSLAPCCANAYRRPLPRGAGDRADPGPAERHQDRDLL